MSSAYLRYQTGDPEVDQHTMPPYVPKDEPIHELGNLIYIRLLTKTEEGGWTAHWEQFRMNERYGRSWVPGTTFWWEDRKQWLHPEETPAELGMEHGHTIRVINTKKPEVHDTVPLVRLQGEQSY